MAKRKKGINSYIKTSQELSDYLRKKAENHNHYKSYSSLKRTVAIRDNRELYLGRSDEWNDITDRDSFNNTEGKVKFCKCFSYSKEESVAMWMLYGGIDKQSGMIDFTQKGIRSILKTGSIELGCFEEDKFVPISHLGKDDFEIWITDVVYYKKNSKKHCIRRSDETAVNVTEKVLDGLSDCKKVYAWQYENECRLIISVNKELVSKDVTDVKIDLSKMDLGKSLERIYRGPNYPLKDTMGSDKSSLTGTVDWNLV